MTCMLNFSLCLYKEQASYLSLEKGQFPGTSTFVLAQLQVDELIKLLQQQSSSHLATPVHPRLESFDETVRQQRAKRWLEEGLITDVSAKVRKPLLGFRSGNVE